MNQTRRSSAGAAFAAAVCSLLFATVVHADNHTLPYRPIDAGYSEALDRVIFITETPNRLHVYDPRTRITESVNLDLPPLALSVNRVGDYAAVLHSTTVSYVNLQTKSVERVFLGPAPRNGVLPRRLALGTAWIHLSTMQSIRISDGSISGTGGFSNDAPMVLSPDGAVLYIGNNRYFVNGGPLPVDGSQLPTNFSYCLSLHVTRAGTRLIQHCGFVLQASANAAIDGTYDTELLDLSSSVGIPIRAVAEAPNGLIAAVADAVYSGQDDGMKVNLYEPAYLQKIGTFSLARTTATGGGTTFRNNGRWLFYSNSGQELFAVVQAESSSGLLNDYSVQTFALANASPCVATFASSTAAVNGAGTLADIAIQAPADCVYNVTSSAPSWLAPVSNGYGSGNQTLRYVARPNTTGAARSATLSLGGSQTLTVTQAAAPAWRMNPLSVNVLDAVYNKTNDTIVYVSAVPPELHVYNPATKTDTFIALPKQPSGKLTLTLDGRTAAVGHHGWVSYINLQTSTLERMIKVPDLVAGLVLGGNGHLYYEAGRGAGVVTVPLASNNTFYRISNYSSYSGLRLHPSAARIYGSSSRFDIGLGALTFAYSLSNGLCSPFWFSETGNRIFSACGAVYRSSNVQAEDGQPNGTLVTAGFYNTPTHADHSAAQQAVAATYTTGEVYVFRDSDLQQRSRMDIPGFGADGSVATATGSNFVFWTRDGSKLWVLAQANLNSNNNLISGWGVAEMPALECTYQLSPSTAQIPYGPSGVRVEVTTQPGCRWNLTSDVSWMYVSGGSAPSFLGSQTLQLGAEGNPTGAARQATIRIGGSTVTVSQLANPGTVRLSTDYLLVGRESYGATIGVQTSNRYLGWTVTRVGAANSWVNVSPDYGVGSATTYFYFQTNQTGAPRTAQFRINGTLVTVEQGVNALPILNPQSQQIPQAGGLVSVSINAAGPWVASSYSSWLTVEGASSGTGPGSVTFRATANNLPGTRYGSAQINGVQAGFSQSGATGLQFYPLPPCRIADTRSAAAPLGGPYMEAQTTRNFPVRSAPCGIPANATAYSLNVTVVPHGPLGYLTIYPTGTERPLTSLLNAVDGRIKANSTLLAGGTDGSVSVFVTNRTDVVLDINGYFAPPGTGGLYYNPITPCRALDTRLSGGMVPALATRRVQLAGICAVPTDAKALAVNVTAIPRTSLGYVTVYPAGQTRPVASTLNAVTGAITANSAIVPAGTNGAIDAFVNGDTDLLFDITGYFSDTPGQSGYGYLFYPLPPCRLADTRNGGGLPLEAGTPRMIYPDACEVSEYYNSPFVMNATVVPRGPLGYLTLWPLGQDMPLVSTLNAVDGQLTSNTVILSYVNGFNSFASGSTDVFFDVTGMFGR